MGQGVAFRVGEVILKRLFEEGAVEAGAGPLAVVRQIDVVYADVKQPVSAP